MKPPTSPDEWWGNLNARWSDILQCFENAGAPMSSNIWRDEIRGEEVVHDHSFLVTLEKLRETRDPKMARMLNLCWLAAPDHPSIHRWPSWGVLCDLCSEEWCLDPEEVRQYNLGRLDGQAIKEGN